MDIKFLEDFLQLAESGNFSKAAAERNVTQPAFSRRIKSLEIAVGVPLIDRSNYPTSLTPAGEAFRDAATDIVQSFYLAVEAARAENARDFATVKKLRNGAVPAAERATGARLTAAIKMMARIARY